MNLYDTLIDIYLVIAADHGSEWVIQGIALLISTLCAVAGYFAFWLGRKESPPRVLCSTFFWVSLFTSLIWYVMPLLPQPRFPSLIQGILHADLVASTIGVAGATMFLIYGVQALQAVRANHIATGVHMCDFLAPATLLTNGPYARIRHPMFMGDFLAHFGLCLATGALFTAPLLPIYFALSAGFNLAEERWVLSQRFGDKYQAYRTSVPFAITPWTALPMAIGTLLFVIGALSLPGIS
jgi:protein-S-isoprenylcysteine O-methyltransferase Ste14